MKVRSHAEASLVALTGDLPVPASVILARLRAMPPPPRSAALEVCRMTMSLGADQHLPPEQRRASNGDSVVVIVRNGEVVTAMLRRSWQQPFTPHALRVDEVERWKWDQQEAAA